MAPLQILIIGCSVAGPTLASFLLLSPQPTSQKPHITILERSSTLRTEGQNVDIRGAGVTIIRKLGLEPVIRAATSGEEGVQFVDADNRVWGAFAADKSGRMRTPTADIEILRGTLAEICFKRSKSISDEVQRGGGAGIEYIFGDYLDEMEEYGAKVHVHFAKSGQRQSYDLVVGLGQTGRKVRRGIWCGARRERRFV